MRFATVERDVQAHTKPEVNSFTDKHDWCKKATDVLPHANKHFECAVLALLTKEGQGRSEGVAFAAICNNFVSTPLEEVRVALERLVLFGDLLTTIDEEHCQCL